LSIHPCTHVIEAPTVHSRAGGEALSAGELIALHAAEKPAMVAIIAGLQSAVLTAPWSVRAAAAQAVAKVGMDG
jgi:hypothetical protein